MNKQDALLVALNALQAIDDEHPYPIAKHAIVQISRVLAQPEPWDTSDMAHRSGGLSVEQSQHPLDIADRAYFAGKQDGIDETLAQPTKPWIGLDENDFEYQPPQTVLTMKFAEAILRDRNK